MRKKVMLAIVLCLVIATTWTVLYAHMAKQVLKTDMKDGNQVVGTRKFLMQTVKANMIDLTKKLKAGNIKDIAANGTGIAAVATVLPPLYMNVQKASYPFEGSKSYFKGAAPDAFEAAAEKMRAAGMSVKNAADKGDEAGVNSGLEALKASCGGCHKAFRGKY